MFCGAKQKQGVMMFMFGICDVLPISIAYGSSFVKELSEGIHAFILILTSTLPNPVCEGKSVG
jgi:hypothetical protein